MDIINNRFVVLEEIGESNKNEPPLSSVFPLSLQKGTDSNLSWSPGASNMHDTIVVKSNNMAYIILAEVEFL